ncbi:hypothetical protein F2981_32110 (plasmid) [Sinorhizobium meliloti]|nr:hypothetical protein [Sinorhizobium meliloti]
MHICAAFAVSRYRLAALAVQRFPPGNSGLEFTRSPSKQRWRLRPTARREPLSRLNMPRGGSRTAAPALPPAQRHPQRALMAIAESEYVLFGDFSNLRVSSSYVAVSKR